MARRFFTGGPMPSADLLLDFERDLALVETLARRGTHYARTSEAWLEKLPRTSTRSSAAAAARSSRDWRVFFLACAELWGYRDGTEWLVAPLPLRAMRTRSRGHP